MSLPLPLAQRAGPAAHPLARDVSPAAAQDTVAAGVSADAGRWVEDTLGAMTLDQRIGQLLTVGIQSGFTPTDSDAFARAARAVGDFHAGGLIVFGAAEGGGAGLGQPLAVAAFLNRLQEIARTPLLVAADFEFGVGMRIAGGTAFPRAMAFAAAGDATLLEEAARITAHEARALGIHLNLAPVADVNNNARNPVINTRAFGETPGQVASMVSSYVRALQQGGMLATLKHFPGHGDTAVDSHLGLPLIPSDRSRLDAIELPPFRAGIAAGAAAVMTSHIELPALEPEPGTPATFSAAATTTLLRDDLGFDGLVLTDSMSMAALAQTAVPREAAVRAVLAGHDLLVDVPDIEAAFFGIAAAIERGEVSLDRIDASVRRVLRAKAAVGLHQERRVPLDAVPERVGTRPGAGLAAEVASRSFTLVRDAGGVVPLRLASDATLLYVSVLDSAGGWGSAAPGRAFGAGLRARWPRTMTVEVSERSTPAEIEAVIAQSARADALVFGVFVRTLSGSGRMDLPLPLARLVNEVGQSLRTRGAPVAAVVLGNPYVAAALPDVPVLALTYDWSVLAERAAVRALTGELPIGGRLPVSLGPPEWPRGFGLAR